MLGTSISKANRVLQRLAKQEIVIRRRSSGTFVGPAMSEPSVPGIHSVTVLYPSDGDAKPESLMSAVTEAMPDVAEVRFIRVPRKDDVEFVHGLLEPIRLAGQLAGVVSISCSRDVYAYLGENDYPLVVMGTLFPGQSYPSIDTDEYQAGVLTAQYLVERGHTRLALISKATRPGDNFFHDGVSDANGGQPAAQRVAATHTRTRRRRSKRTGSRALRDRSLSHGIHTADSGMGGHRGRRCGAARDCAVPEDIEIVFQQGSALGHAEKTRFQTSRAQPGGRGREPRDSCGHAEDRE